MAVDLPIRFGRGSNRFENREEAPEFEQSKLWLNVGAQTDDEDYTFLAIPRGIPLDNVDPLKVSGKNEKFKHFRSAQNDLLAQLKKLGEGLKPGEDMIINLQCQLRRIDDSEAGDVDMKNNPFGIDLAPQKQA